MFGGTLYIHIVIYLWNVSVKLQDQILQTCMHCENLALYGNFFGGFPSCRVPPHLTLTTCVTHTESSHQVPSERQCTGGWPLPEHDFDK